MRKSMIFILALAMALSVVILPADKAEAKAKCWYGKYWELRETGMKAVKIKGRKVYLRGKWTFSASRYTDEKPKKIKKTLKLTGKTKYYLDDTSTDAGLKRISKKKFRKYLYSDLAHCAFKVKSRNKVVQAVISLN